MNTKGMSSPERGAEMSVAELRQIYETHGADPVAWPEERRKAALALLAQSPAARAVRAEAERLDHLLDTVTAPKPSPGLVRAVRALAPSGRRSTPVPSGRALPTWLTVAGWVDALSAVPRPAALAAMAIVGIGIGWIAPHPTDGAGNATLQTVASETGDVSTRTAVATVDEDDDGDWNEGDVVVSGPAPLVTALLQTEYAPSVPAWELSDGESVGLSQAVYEDGGAIDALPLE